jgi:hypothetical protein
MVDGGVPVEVQEFDLDEDEPLATASPGQVVPAAGFARPATWLRGGGIGGWRAALVAVLVAVLVGAGGGAVAMHAWDRGHPRPAEFSPSSMIALMDSTQACSPYEGERTSVTVTCELRLINAGVVPVRLFDVRSDQPGLTITRPNLPWHVKAGGQSLMTIEMEGTCADDAWSYAQVPLHLIVAGPDGVKHPAAPFLTLEGTHVPEDFDLACRFRAAINKH